MSSLRTAAAAGVLCICVALLGPARGVVVGVLAAPLAAGAVAWAHGRPVRVRASPSLALALDLVAVALRAGQPPDAALLLAAPAAADAGHALVTVGGLLRLGADPGDAWAVLDAHGLGVLAAVARRSASSGVRLASAFEAHAAEVRAQLGQAAQARAQRVGVLAAAPLGLCFLPSFVCLGIVPALIGLARGGLG